MITLLGHNIPTFLHVPQNISHLIQYYCAERNSGMPQKLRVRISRLWEDPGFLYDKWICALKKVRFLCYGIYNMPPSKFTVCVGIYTDQGKPITQVHTNTRVLARQHILFTVSAAIWFMARRHQRLWFLSARHLALWQSLPAERCRVQRAFLANGNGTAICRPALRWDFEIGFATFLLFTCSHWIRGARKGAGGSLDMT